MTTTDILDTIAVMEIQTTYSQRDMFKILNCLEALAANVRDLERSATKTTVTLIEPKDLLDTPNPCTQD